MPLQVHQAVERVAHQLTNTRRRVKLGSVVLVNHVKRPAGLLEDGPEALLCGDVSEDVERRHNGPGGVLRTDGVNHASQVVRCRRDDLDDRLPVLTGPRLHGVQIGLRSLLTR
ncbi:hypothetical protein, partial [Streptomyces sp. NPDC056154]|uniref:hypothetical protein n=1 Tax=Streptomyces sp. NPDC056154 TaxID=3345729 RepID=UPI0035DAE1C1